MKNLLLSFILMAFYLSCFSQERVPFKNSDINKAEKRQHFNYLENSFLEKPMNPMVSGFISEDQIGNSTYDKQTNGCLANRMVKFDDGSLSVVWIMGFEATGFADRGTGYNYYDGSSWGPIPTARFESVKTGWPSIAPWGENGEIIVSHNAVDALIISRRPQKGTGSWTETTISGPPSNLKITWPRVVTSGPDNNIVHILVHIRDTYNGQNTPLGYYRSPDGGDNWDIQYQVIEAIGPGYYTEISADEATFAEPRANTLAFLITSAWHDLILMKSNDNGDTWQKTIIWEHPYPFWDWNTSITTDTLWAPDNSGDIALDNTGMAHVAFGLTRVAHEEAGTTFSFWPFSDGIAYWNEDRPPFEDPNGNPHDALDADDVLIEDYNLIGWTQDVDGNGVIEFEDEIMSYGQLGISTMPNIAISEASNMIVVNYASTTEGFTNTVNNFKHLWSRSAYYNGTDWTWNDDFTDITSDLIHIFDECFYPNMADDVDGNGNYYVSYQADASPGNAVDGDHAYQDNRIIAFKPFGTGISEPEKPFGEDQVSEVIPSALDGEYYILVDLDRKSDLGYEVFNLVGQKVLTQASQVFNKGKQTLVLNMGGMKEGVYFCVVKSGKERVTRKMIRY